MKILKKCVHFYFSLKITTLLATTFFVSQSAAQNEGIGFISSNQNVAQSTFTTNNSNTFLENNLDSTQTDWSKNKKNSVEGSILLPFFPGNELSLKYTRTLWQNQKIRGEFVTGIHFHIRSERDGGIYDDYQIVLGYRQFLWKGLHVEGALQPKLYYKTVGATYSDRTHEGYGLFLYTMAGYQIEALKRQNYSFILNFQPVGLAYSTYHSDDWTKDETGRTADYLLYFGNISVGMRF